MNIFIVFAGEHYYPSGGAEDIIGSAISIQQAEYLLVKKQI